MIFPFSLQIPPSSPSFTRLSLGTKFKTHAKLLRRKTDITANYLLKFFRPKTGPLPVRFSSHSIQVVLPLCQHLYRMEPVLPPEVVDIILGYCGRKELLNSRLVCKAWNDFCLRHLIKSNHIISLPFNKIKAFLRFIRNTRSKPVLPLKVASLPILYDLDDTVIGLESLLDGIGSHPIVHLKLGCTNSALLWIKVLPFLKKVASKLKSLQLPPAFFNGTQEMTDKAAEINFPRLKCLGIVCKASPSQSEIVFYSSLLSRCPVLEVLEISGNLSTNSGDVEIQIPFKSLKAFNNHSDSVKSLSGLLNQIRAGTPGYIKLESCRLNPLYCNIRVSEDCRAKMLEIVQALAPSLRHMFYSTRCNANDLPIFLTHFPVLSRLDVNIEFRSRGFNDFICSLNLSPKLLPALTTLSVLIGPYLLAMSDSEPLMTVRHLILKGPRSPMCSEDYQIFFKHVFKICPNTKSLSVEASPGPNSCVKPMISKLMQCSEAAGIQEFGLWNYGRDWIGEELLGFPYTGRTTRSLGRSHSSRRECTLQNVRKIRLSQGEQSFNCSPWYGRHGYPIENFELDFNSEMPGHSSSDKRILYLDAIRNHFPNLRSLEFSRCMLGSDYHSSWAAARAIQSKYPNWQVDLITDDSELFPLMFKSPYPQS